MDKQNNPFDKNDVYLVVLLICLFIVEVLTVILS